MALLESEQDSLLRSLRGLIASRSPDPFLCNVLIEPDARFFPDPWEPSECAVRRVVRRLLSFVDLGDLDVTIEIVGDRDADTRFEALEDGVCRIAVGEGWLHRPHDVLIAALCRAVAAAFRAHHAL